MRRYENRKQLRLKDFDYANDGCFFVTICTYNRQTLFGNPVGAPLCGRPDTNTSQQTYNRIYDFPNEAGKMVEKWLFELENKYKDVSVCEYIIMPDHIHFIISKHGAFQKITGDHAGSPLQDVVGWLKTMTTNNYIKNVKNKVYPPFQKKVWQRGYYEHIIRNIHDYDSIAEYIINNPDKYNFENDPIIGKLYL